MYHETSRFQTKKCLTHHTNKCFQLIHHVHTRGIHKGQCSQTHEGLPLVLSSPLQSVGKHSILLVLLLRLFLLELLQFFVSIALFKVNLIEILVLSKWWNIRFGLLLEIRSLSFGIRVSVVQANVMNLSMSLDYTLHDFTYTLIRSHQADEEVVLRDWWITQPKLDPNPTMRW